MTCGDYKKQRGHKPRRKLTMYTIEYDASPAPWKITADDGTEWHAATDAEAEAVIELAAFIIGREQQARPPCQPCLVERLGHSAPIRSRPLPGFKDAVPRMCG
jgi:hypothetical protein